MSKPDRYGAVHQRYWYSNNTVSPDLGLNHGYDGFAMFYCSKLGHNDYVEDKARGALHLAVEKAGAESRGLFYS